MDSDRELLELAAKAAGIEYRPDIGYRVTGIGATGMPLMEPWNPRDDDGDAFRLALKLKLNIAQGEFSAGVNNEAEIDECAFVRSEEERAKVVRSLIVYAAAQLGKAMP